jgi:methylmalonyl-CoA decarboxylase
MTAEARTLVRTADVGEEGADRSVVEVTMANTARRNALGSQMLEELAAALSQAQAADARAVIIRAEPGVSTWSAGYDIEALPVDGSDPLTWTNPLESLLHEVRAAPFPVIAAVEGGVWGGACELAMTCDLVVATQSATFAVTPVRLGVPYNTAGVNHFLAALPLNVVKEMFFTGDPITAEAAAAYGVVNRLVADSTGLSEAATALGRRIALRAPLAVRAIKGELTALTDARSLTSDDFERLTELRRAAWTSDDYQEGVRAFREKRSPRFYGT